MRLLRLVAGGAVLAVSTAAASVELRVVRTEPGEAHRARHDIERAGGRVTHVLPDGRLVVAAAATDRGSMALPGEEAPWPQPAPLAVTPAEAAIPDGPLWAEPDRAEGTAVTPSSSPVLAGDIVIALALPESTGEAEPSVIDWTADDVDRAVARVVDGTLAFALAPGAPRLTFHLHLLDAPPPGGVGGTVACAYEPGRHSTFDPSVDASWLAALGYTGSLSAARRQLAEDLRQRFGADGAFVAKVIHDGGLPAGRPAAILNGPQATWFLSTAPAIVAHETAHVFGALDEYCPDACRSPSQLSGHALGVNGNSRGNDGTGYFGGAGEGRPCLMLGGSTELCPHTRRQLGWRDGDGDGRVDVEDGFARTVIDRVERQGGGLLVSGRAELLATLGTQPVRLGSVAAVEVRLGGGAWVEAEAADGAFDGADEEYRAELALVPDGHYLVEARATSAAGNVARRWAAVTVHVSDSTVADAVPTAALAVNPRRARHTTWFHFDASAASDLEGTPLAARFDFDGDDRFDTPWGPLFAEHRYAAAGDYQARVEVMDLAGQVSRASVEVAAATDDLPPELGVVATPLASGDGSVRIRVDASASRDPEGEPLAFEIAVDGEAIGPGPQAVVEREIGATGSAAVVVTVRATDPAGASAEAVRVVLVDPFDLRPAAALIVAAGADPGEWRLDASASSDADAGAPWDGWLGYRFDWDGDGQFDTPFVAGEAQMSVAPPAGAIWQPVVEVRDRFDGRAVAAAKVDLREAPVFAAGTALRVEADACGVRLAWNSATSTSSPLAYVVYRADLTLGQDWVAVGRTARADHLDATVVAGHRYAYLVRAALQGETPLEDDNREVAEVTAPAATTTLHPTAAMGQVRLQWDPPVLALVWSGEGAAEGHVVARAAGATVVAGRGSLTWFRLTPAACAETGAADLARD